MATLFEPFRHGGGQKGWRTPNRRDFPREASPAPARAKNQSDFWESWDTVMLSHSGQKSKDSEYMFLFFWIQREGQERIDGSTTALTWFHL